MKWTKERAKKYDKEYHSKYRMEHPDYVERQKKYWILHPIERLKIHREYIKNNPKKLSEYQKTQRARKYNAVGYHTFGEWELLKKQYGYTCPCCGKSEPTIKLTEDHIVPLSKGGSNYIENIQPLCHSCNSRKHTLTVVYENKFSSLKFKKEV